MKISEKLSVDDILATFVEAEVLPGTGIAPAAFWASLESVLADFTPKNAELLAKRDELQAKIDALSARVIAAAEKAVGAKLRA